MSTKDKEKDKVDLARSSSSVEDTILDMDAVTTGIQEEDADGAGEAQRVGVAGKNKVDATINVGNQEGATTEIPLESFTGFKAALALPTQSDAPLVFDIVYQGKVFLVGFALAHMTDEGLAISPLNEQLFPAMRRLIGETVCQPLFGTTIPQVEACLASMKNYESGTPFLVMCNDIGIIQKMIRRLHISMQGSFAIH